MPLRTARAIQNVWVCVGIGLLMLVLLEGVSRVVVGFMPLNDSGGSSTAERPSWWPQYTQEITASDHVRWQPYVYWRRPPFHGTYINIDAAGLRRTWNSTPTPSTNQIKVFMFGGSTMWGTGDRDEFTIPSLVSKMLAKPGARGVWVTNYGETGYVSTQEVIALMLALRQGNVPDIVVFYDGVNDAWSAFQTGIAGIPQNEANRAAEFNSLNWRRGFMEQLALYRLLDWARGDWPGRLVAKSPLYRLGKWAAGSLRKSRPKTSPTDEIQQTTSLADSVVDTYGKNLVVVAALARQYGFREVAFWQPTIYTKRHLSPRERQLYESAPAPFFSQVSEAFRQRTRGANTENIYDLSGLFDEEQGTVFIDMFHLNEKGNAKVAEAMVRVLNEMGAK